MREDIFDINEDGQRVLNLYRFTGKGYENAWFTNNHCRYRILKGGRSTKKSYDMIGIEPVMKVMSNPQVNVMICRKNDSDLKQSAFANLCGRINDMGLDEYWKMTVSPMELTYIPTGQKIIFRGMNNPTSINSVTFAVGYLTDVYIEEAFEIDNEADFIKLDGSVRGRLPPGLYHQITLCLNAWDGESWIYNKFFKNRFEDNFDYLDRDDVTYDDYEDVNYIGDYGTGLYLHTSTFKINEFRDEKWDMSMAELKKRDIERYKVEALGMWGVTTGAVYRCWDQSLAIPIQKIIGIDSHGFPAMDFADFAIGIDTGLSSGEGKIKVVKKGESQDIKVKAATTMSLCAITSDMNKLVCIEEYFHSNNKGDNACNTDDQENLTEPQQLDRICEYIRIWKNKYESSPTILMKGQINIYVDSADIGFRQVLEMKLREHQIFGCVVMGSTKKPIRTRVSFENLMMAYGEFLVCDSCKNCIREIKNCRKGERNIARADGNDHFINALEYAQAPFYPMLNRWKTFKEY